MGKCGIWSQDSWGRAREEPESFLEEVTKLYCGRCTRLCKMKRREEEEKFQQRK